MGHVHVPAVEGSEGTLSQAGPQLIFSLAGT